MTDFDPDIREYYDLGGERDRITGTLELVRTKVLLERLLPAPPATVLDVGGAFGVYAEWLAELGHRVRLVDPVPLHVESAREHGIDAVVGDARALSEPDASQDVVLLLGPLYHLTDRADRVRALAEARRVARPGGVVVAAMISRWASMFEGLLTGLIDVPEFAELVDEDLATGTHRGAPARFFTTAFFHRPAEVAAEWADAGLALADLVAVEGMANWLPDVTERLADERKRAKLLTLIDRTAREPEILGATAHLLAIAHT